MRRAAAGLALLVLSGCVAQRPVPTSTIDVDAQWQIATDQSEPALEQWWQQFADPQLNKLVQQALQHNRELRGAQWRVVEAQAGTAAARGARLPALALDTRYTRFEQSIESPQAAGPLIAAGIVPRDGEFYTTSLLANWELDIFGGLRARQTAAAARERAAIAAADGTALQVIAETVSAYNDVASFAQRARIAQRNVDLQQKTLDIVRGKVGLGLARKLDEVRAVADLERLAADVPRLEAQRHAALQRLIVLTGDRALLDTLSQPDTVLAAPADVAVGLPADVLRRRPDVRVAEQELESATALTQDAVAAFFPSLQLTASGGFEAGTVDALNTGAARAVGIVPFVRWPLFQGGRLRAQLSAARAREQQAFAAYEQSILGALADTESALAAFRGAQQSVARIALARDAARESETLARKLYGEGLSDFLTLLDAQRQLARIDDALIATQAELVLSTARLYKSLGGGWSGTSNDE
ncbi:MAG: efflux transporter outer membrane subunit [Pseudomonadota bacterium]